METEKRQEVEVERGTAKILLERLVICCFFVALLSGCNSRRDTVEGYDYTSNVRDTAGGYIMYEIEEGSVTCREHSHRAELACWKNR